jgi:hypothetical protein
MRYNIGKLTPLYESISVGNRRFRMCIENNLSHYVKAKSRQEKSQMVCNIVEGIKANSSPGAGFIKKVRIATGLLLSLTRLFAFLNRLTFWFALKDLFANRWFEVGGKMARDKVGQALRDAMKIQRAKKGDSPRVDGALRGSAAGKAGNSTVERRFKSGNYRDAMNEVVSSNTTIVDSSRRSRADSFDDSISDSGDSLWPHMALPAVPLQPILPPRESSDDLASLLMSNPPSCLMPPPAPLLVPTYSAAVHIPAALVVGRELMYAPDNTVYLGIHNNTGVREEDHRSVPYRSLWSDHDLLPNPVTFPAEGLKKKESVKLPEDELQFLRANSDPFP